MVQFMEHVVEQRVVHGRVRVIGTRVIGTSGASAVGITTFPKAKFFKGKG